MKPRDVPLSVVGAVDGVLPPLRAHDYYGRDSKLRMAKAELQHRRRLPGAACGPTQVRSVAVDPHAGSTGKPGPRAVKSSSSSSFDDYTPWRDEADGLHQ